jgi:outer membrane protein OmpA-like peptidoglycan-associated protein
MSSYLKPAARLQTLALVVLIAITLPFAAGCKSLSNTEKGAAAGAGAGAVIGGVIGKAVGSTAKGAIIGALVGGTAGAIIGRQMDRQAQELKGKLKGARVERVGEGIVVTFDSGLLFDFDSSALRPEARANLELLAESVNKYDNTEVLIVGHTDNVGTDAYNFGLSRRRAESASGYMAGQGVRPSRLSTSGKGESDPIATNDTEAGRQKNRRVEIVIYAGEEFRKELEEESTS